MSMNTYRLDCLRDLAIVGFRSPRFAAQLSKVKDGLAIRAASVDEAVVVAHFIAEKLDVGGSVMVKELGMTGK